MYREAVAVIPDHRVPVRVELFDSFDVRDGRTSVYGRLWYEATSGLDLQSLPDGTRILIVFPDGAEELVRTMTDFDYPVEDGVVSVIEARAIRDKSEHNDEDFARDGHDDR